MRVRTNRIMAHLPYDVPGGREGVTVQQLVVRLNLSDHAIRETLRTLVGQQKVRRIRVRGDALGGGTWKIRYAIERK